MKCDKTKQNVFKDTEIFAYMQKKQYFCSKFHFKNSRNCNGTLSQRAFYCKNHGKAFVHLFGELV